MNYLSPPPLKVPFIDSKGHPNEWIQFFTQLESLFNNLQRTGTTAHRPSPASFVGYQYFDTTLQQPVWWTGSTWVGADGLPA